jgi:hypothetical protein
MSPVTIGSGTEQNPITVNAMWHDPLVVPMLLRTFFRQAFVADQILRNVGRVQGGAVQFWVSGPVEPDAATGGVEVVAPLAEIPVANPIIGTPDSVQVLKRGLGLRISRELEERNNVGAVLLGIQQIRNAMVRSVDGALMTALRAAVTQTVAVTTPWDAASGTTIRKDWTAANRIVENLRDTGFDYSLDTLIVNRNTRDALMFSPEFQAQFIGNVADQNYLLTGTMPTRIWNFTVLTSPQVNADEAFAVQSKVIGGIADERGSGSEPIEVSDPYPEPAYEAIRRNVTRATAGFVDNPGALIRFTNVET